MLLVIEYLQRSGELYDYISFPISLYLSTKNHNTKIVITIKRSFVDESMLSVKHWFISSCSKDKALPTIKDYYIHKESLFDHPATIIGAFQPLPYNPIGIKSSKNLGNGGHPMDEDLYKKYLLGVYQSREHKTNKEIWLWESFLEIYFEKAAEYILDLKRKQESYWFNSHTGEYIDHRRTTGRELRRQQERVEIYFKQIWKIWEIWKRHLLFDERIAGEFLFSNAYTTS